MCKSGPIDGCNPNPTTSLYSPREPRDFSFSQDERPPGRKQKITVTFKERYRACRYTPQVRGRRRAFLRRGDRISTPATRMGGDKLDIARRVEDQHW